MLVALMNDYGLNNAEESAVLKTFVLEGSNAAKLRFALRSFENNQCLRKFRQQLAGLMGAAFLRCSRRAQEYRRRLASS